MSQEVPKIAPILEICGLNAQEQKHVLEVADAQNIFSGQAAVNLGKISKESLDRLLLTQAQGKTAQAVKDLSHMSNGNTPPLVTPEPVFSNIDPNNAGKDPGMAAGASAAANMAEIMVRLISGKPELAKDNDINNGIRAAAGLALNIKEDGQLKYPVEQQLLFLSAVETGLKTAIAKSGITPKDRSGNAVILDDYIKGRFDEIKDSYQAIAIEGRAVEAENRRRSGPAKQGGGPVV